MMRRLELDLVKTPTPAWPGVLLLAVAAAFAAFSYWQYMNVSERRQATQRELAQFRLASQKAQAGQQSSSLSFAEMEIEDRRAREVAAMLLVPWRDLFAALESAAQNDVSLLAIEPDHKKHQLRIIAETRDFDALTGYLKRLGGAAQLKSVRLLHYEVREEDAQHPLRFTIEAAWRLPS